MPTDRRAGKKNVPHVGKEPRSRRKDGGWRRKRSDAGKKKGPKNDFGIPGIKL